MEPSPETTPGRHPAGAAAATQPLGEPLALSSKALNAGSAALETFAPLKLRVRQCVIYDSDQPDARLIGVEYIISRRLFEQLPDEEKRFWHSHVFEVTSGQLTAPNVPEAVERVDMAKLINTYGKTWHLWQVDRGDALPLGPPMLMMALTAPGQLDEAQLAARDAALGVDSGANANARQGLQADPPEPHPLADHPWHTGRSWQTVMQQVEFRRAVSVATTAPGTAAGPAKAYMRC